MNTQHRRKLASNPGPILSALVLVLSSLLASTACAGVEAAFAYKLSDFSGPVPSLWAKVDVDSRFDEAYTLNIGDGLIQIYNESAMQVHSYGEDYGLASAVDLAVAEEGEVYVLFSRRTSGQLLRLDYRGELIEAVTITDVPDEFLPLHPTFMDYRDGEIYLADSRSMTMVVVDLEGRFQRGLDLRSFLLAASQEELNRDDLRESQRRMIEEEIESLKQAALGGFSVDARDQIYFTVPTLFSAYRMQPDGQFEVFGTSGGARGKFGVVAGIEADEHGNIYVADRLRSVVLIFDGEFNFQTEMGYRGGAPHNLVVPDDLAVDARNNKLYVSQAANLGVSVFKLRFN